MDDDKQDLRGINISPCLLLLLPTAAVSSLTSNHKAGSSLIFYFLSASLSCLYHEVQYRPGHRPPGGRRSNLTSHREAPGAPRTSRVRPFKQPPIKADTSEAKATTEIEYDSNWAGAVLVGTGYNSVTAEFTVPTPSDPSSSSGERGSGSEAYCAAALVGIDGDACTSAILQTGVDFCIDGNEVDFQAWYGWYPAVSYDFDLHVSAGDVIKATVNATSDTSGTTTLENISTGEAVSHTFTEVTDGCLCMYNAEWIVEDFEVRDSYVAFADFDTVTFSSAYADTTSGDVVGPADATIFDIEHTEYISA